ncbi:MAG: YkgJ family cysteine cluster protein [Lachnospiraceae bacterium]|nr:YkgJ family cysteine cluster protein [Robinsoniella sp.]MDY3765093.1 YkgJ family cysteine cluster protein [Lachnospiraceae bacterium]
MKRQVTLDEISDGKLYGLNDMVKADCGDCKGCSACCHGMGSSVILDPLDIYRMCTNLRCSFEQLLDGKIELNIVDGIILPNLQMTGEEERCPFLNHEERCSIHAFRPSICRLFPLGRYYEENGFRYFLQVHECKKENRAKVKVRKWIDTPNLRENEKFVMDWHNFLKAMEEIIEDSSDDNLMKNLDMAILKIFYMKPYDKDRDFYVQFAERIKEAESFAQMIKR